MLDAEKLDKPETQTPPPLDQVAEGERLFGEGRLDEAEASFEAAAEACPGNAMAWNNLGVLAMHRGDDRQAEKFLRRALEVRGDLMDARLNLVEIYCFRQQWSRAARELEKALEIKPADLAITKRLAQIYLNMSQPEKAKELLDGSKGLGAVKAFIDSLWLGIKCHGMADELSPRDKMEKFVGALLKFLDGRDGGRQRYKLISYDAESGEEVLLEDLYDSFYYKESPSMTLAAGSLEEPDCSALVLTIGDNEDWDFFREALRAEMRSEGGCLGDFTQTRKVFRHEKRLAKYNLNATLKYFQDNVGPCDCHVLRAVLV